MVKLELKLLSLSLILSHSILSQNLLKNGDFELTIKLFNYALPRIILFQWQSDLCEVKHWDNPNRTSADVLKNGFNLSYLGRSKSYSGNYYLGLIFASDGFRDEYAETKLKKKLKKDSLYCIKFYTMADSKHGSYLKRLYISFSDKYYHQRNDNFFFLPDTIGFQKEDASVIQNTDDYIELSNIYKSKGDESHLIIGPFNKNERFHYSFNSSDYHKVILHKRKYAYYYYDDISVTPIKDSSECPCYYYKKPKHYEEINILRVNQLSGKKYILSNLKFGAKKTKMIITNATKDELQTIVEVLQKDSLVKFTIVSHVFETDVMPLNKKLSEERAKELKDYFVSEKINTKRIEIIGMGSGMPLFDNDTKEHQENNTRTEIRFD